MRAGALLLFLLTTPCTFAQEPPSVKDKAMAYIDALTAPTMHGRGYVNGGDSLAAEWIAQQFDRIGLAPLEGSEGPRRFEPFRFPVNTFPDSVRVSVDGRSLRPGIDFITDPASGPADGRYTLVHLSLADFADAERKARTMGVVQGHAVLFHAPHTTDKDTLERCAAIEAELVRYVPVIRQGGEKLTWSVATEQWRNAVIEVRAGMVPDTAATVELHVRNHFVPRHEARNVLGVVKARGRSKDWLVVTAHYDHLGRMGPDALFPGANDNASGVSMLLCLAEQVRQRSLKVNVLFIAFAGEEAGLQGSSWCVVDRPIDLARIKLLVNLDLNGTGDDGITVVNATEQKKAFDTLVRINDRTHRLPQVKPRGPACNSDHCPFARKGVPAIFIYTMGGVTYYHDVNDRAETLPLTKFDALYRTLLDLFRKVG